MSKHIEFETLELAIEQSSPYMEICYELIENCKFKLKDLIHLSGIDEDNLIHYLKLIGGCYLAERINDANDDEELINRLEKSEYKDGQKIFEEFSEVSKVALTLDQAYCLGIGVVLIEEAFLEIDRVSISWTSLNKIEQFESFGLIIGGLGQASYYIGQAMGSFYKTRNMELNKSEGIHTKGGEVRAKIYDEKKKEAIRLYESGNYHTYIGCGRKICDQLGVVPETIAKWLSEHYSRK